jgi:hypothetical protein
VQVRRRVAYGEDIAGRLEVALEVVDFEVRILRGFIFDDKLAEDLEGVLLEFLECLSGDEYCERLLERVSEEDREDSRDEEEE